MLLGVQTMQHGAEVVAEWEEHFHLMLAPQMAGLPMLSAAAVAFTMLLAPYDAHCGRRGGSTGIVLRRYHAEKT